MGKIKPVLFLIGLFAAYACILSPTPAETPAETADVTVVPPTSTPEPTADNTATATIPPGFFPIAVGRDYGPGRAVLLGGTENGTWIQAADAAARMAGGETYSLYSPTGPAGTASGSKPSAYLVCTDEYVLDWTPAPADVSLIGLGGPWNALPRIPEAPSLSSYPSYQTAAEDWLAAQGISISATDLVSLAVVARVDLDGDGTMEAVISATRLSDEILHDVAAGDFTIVLLYREAASEMTLLAGDVYPDARDMVFPAVYRLLSILDLNGDGRMEMIVHLSLFEGEGFQVFTYDGSTVDQVLEDSCSA